MRGPDFEVLTGIGEMAWIEINESFIDPGLLTADSVVIYGNEGFSLETTGGLEERQPDPNAWYVFRGGQHANGVPVFICNADHDTGPKPGGVVDGNCHFEYSGEQVTGVFRVLVVKGWAETPQDELIRLDESLASMAVRHIETGNLEYALHAAARMSLAEPKHQLLGQIAQAQIQEDRLQDALGTTKLIGVAPLREDKLNQVAMAHLHAGNPQEAGAVAMLMKTGKLRDDILGRVVNRHREVWELEDAQSVAEQIDNDNSRRQHLYNVAMAQIEAGDYEGAIGTSQLSHAPGNDYRDKVLGRLVDKYREAGNFQEALGVAGQIYRDGWRRQHLRNIARGQVDAGDQESAKATANRIEDSRLRDEVLSEIVRRSR